MMTSEPVRLPRATTRVARISAIDAERQLRLSLGLVAGLILATMITATVGLFA